MTISYCYAQVGINTESPYELTELQILNIINNGDTIPKGIMIPRLTEEQRDAMNVAAATEVNSLLIYNTTEDCYNYYSRLNTEWQSLCGKIGKAQFTLDCSSIEVGGAGTYATETALDASHYIKVKVNVTKAGSYNITALPDPQNGYYFTQSGEFLTTGDFTLIIPGAGTPQTPTADQDDLTQGDLIKFTLNGIDSDCTTTIHIIDSTIKPAFTMNCGSTRSYGTYKIGVDLDATNYITVTINGDVSGGTGAKAVIRTNVVDGMQFISNPVDIVGGIQVITLYGTGQPGSAGTKIFTVSSNSTTSTTTCSASVNVVMKPKRLLTIGTSGTYQYQFAVPGFSTGGAYQFTHDERNFGVLNTSVVQLESFDIVGLPALITPTSLSPYLSGSQKVDMIVIAYNTGWSAANNASIGQLLGDYVKNGNPLFLMGDSNTAGVASSTAWTSIMSNIFDGSTTTVAVQSLANSANTTVSAGTVFRLSSYNHPILNGLFGDARGQYWGEDASSAQVTINLPDDEIIILSGAYDVSTPNFTPRTSQANGSTAFVHRKYPFIFVGDGGFNSHNNSDNTSNIICPFMLDATNFPVPKNNYGRGTNRFAVWNSIIFGNTIAWGLRIVEGIEVQN